MPTTFRDPDQMLLLAPDLRDWVPKWHFAQHVGDLVDGLALRARVHFAFVLHDIAPCRASYKIAGPTGFFALSRLVLLSRAWVSGAPRGMLCFHNNKIPRR